jgi:peptide-methionine (R)-S-oxide reductase
MRHDRRDILVKGVAFLGVVAAARGALAASPMATAATVGGPDAYPYAVVHTEAEWRRLLSPGQFEVLRQAGTEVPWSSALLKEKRHGRFLCAGCRQPKFDEATKFESGTGWPSFWQPIGGEVLVATDTSFGMDRSEVHCATCGGHLGHVFDDGPKPTGLRYCMNGIALEFQADA